MLNPHRAGQKARAHSSSVCAPSLDIEIPEFPKAEFFREHALLEVAMRCDFRANVLVIPADDVFHAISRRAGFDPNSHPYITSGIWEFSGKKDNRDLKRRIQLAFRRNTATDRKDKPALAYSEKITHKVFHWGLTEAGVEEAVALQKTLDPNWRPSWEQNATALWIAEKWAEGWRTKLISKLSRNLPRSANMGEIEDLVDGWITDAMATDRLSERLADGRIPSLSTVAGWMKNRASSKFRDAARDCHSRTFRDAKTRVERSPGATEEEKAVALHQFTSEHSVPSDNVPVFRQEEEDAGSAVSFCGNVGIKDFADPFDLEEYVQHKIDAVAGREQMDASIRFHKSGAPDRYANVLRMMREGSKISDVADAEGCGTNRAATLTADTRSAMRKAAENIDFALKIMTYVHEEPWVTQPEIMDDLDIDRSAKEVSRALERLVDSGWMEATFASSLNRTGNADLVGSYKLTRRGVALLREHQMGDVPMANRFIL